MAKVPFTVSARAARLIGRENVATSQGAVTELVKNSYDADAFVCLVLFRRRWESLPDCISQKEFDYLQKQSPLVANLLSPDDAVWRVREDLTPAELDELHSAMDQVLDMWIVDNGQGMSPSTIESQWMVIGTDTKEKNSLSGQGRVVTGAKGIGRFALDRLGQEAELYSCEQNSRTIAHWLVDWADFEGEGKNISDVEAVLESELDTLDSVYSRTGIGGILPAERPILGGRPTRIDYGTGTAIRIGLLNDLWSKKDLKRLSTTLEALLPPHDRGDFDIYVYDERSPSESGFVDNFSPDQFDYRMQASVHEGGAVTVTLTRQEIDAPRIRSTTFSLDSMQNFPFRRDDFDAGEVVLNVDLAELLGVGEDSVGQYKEVGPVEFTLYFFKLSNASGESARRYPQKNFDVASRRRWLKNSGGIRLYRDNFRVRPYGEPNTPSSDWLLLGERSARNPAQASRIGWRVPPQQVAGTINISKEKNPQLVDQSNREGIMNERAFVAFREIVVALIRQFESDRSYIFHEFSRAYDIDYPDNEIIKEGARIADEVLESAGPRAKSEQDEQSEEWIRGKPKSSQDLEKVSLAFSSERKKNEALRDDLQVMRGMATLGTILVSFTHELKQIQANLESRADRLNTAIGLVSDPVKLASIEPMLSPVGIIERLRRQDEKVSRWVNFALSSVSPNKRRRREINISSYVCGVKEYWSDFLDSKSVNFVTDVDVGVDMPVLAHEIDLDSIFYNLINNSIEALVKPSEFKERIISLSVVMSEPGFVEFTYADNGPGLSSELNVEDDIFSFGVTTKKEESSGDAMGTGLGMWLLKNIVDDYNGELSLNCKKGVPGFSIYIKLPAHKG